MPPDGRQKFLEAFFCREIRALSQAELAGSQAIIQNNGPGGQPKLGVIWAVSPVLKFALRLDHKMES